MRINARLDDSFEEKFLQIQERKQKNRTEILKEALDKYFSDEFRQEVSKTRRNNQKILELSAGVLSGSEDSSTNYKKYVMERLDEKFPDR